MLPGFIYLPEALRRIQDKRVLTDPPKTHMWEVWRGESIPSTAWLTSDGHRAQLNSSNYTLKDTITRERTTEL